MTQDIEHTPIAFPQEERGCDTMAADPATNYGRPASAFLPNPDAVSHGESHRVDYSFLDENLKETATYIRKKLSKKDAHVRFSPQKKVDGGIFKDKYHEFLDVLHADYARRRGIAYKQNPETPEGTVPVDDFFDGLNAFIEWSYAEA